MPSGKPLCGAASVSQGLSSCLGTGDESHTGLIAMMRVSIAVLRTDLIEPMVAASAATTAGVTLVAVGRLASPRLLIDVHQVSVERYAMMCLHGERVRMPLPALRADGTLPTGVHQATLDEVFAAFPATTPERQALNAALTHCVATVRRLHLADQIALDGSYVTSKPDPADVDMVVLTPGVYQLAGEQRYAAEGIDITLLDIQFAHDDADFQAWLTFFSTARGSQVKGLVSLIF